MAEQIRIQKNTLVLAVAFAAIALVFAYVSFSGNGATQGLEGTGINANAVGCTASQKCAGPAPPPAAAAGFQELYLKATGAGYDKSELTVKKGIPVRLHFTAQNAGCGSALIIYGLNVKAVSRGGEEAVVEFTPDKEGVYQYSCSMRMFPPGRFVVTA